MKELTVKASMDSYDEAMAFVESSLEELGCPMKVSMQFNICADEMFSNVVYYAYQNMEPTGDPLFGSLILRVDRIEQDGQSMGCLILEDAGRHFDPTAKADPDVTLSAEDRKIGGLGIYMVKKAMDHVQYAYVNGRNILTMIRKF